ncbi:MAG: HPr family phosphocarrier protein [Elusimicrobia bacterium]|nr:HPr family phosphocarrier protein [Elusimicrobiota bacterium]
MSAPITVQKTFVVPNKLGLHARPAALFVQALQRFRCKVLVAKADTEVNGKSLMGLMMLAAEHGSQLKVTLEGADAPQAMLEIEKLFVRKFDEA